jgi:hypothetical protein
VHSNSPESLMMGLPGLFYVLMVPILLANSTIPALTDIKGAAFSKRKAYGFLIFAVFCIYCDYDERIRGVIQLTNVRHS